MSQIIERLPVELRSRVLSYLSRPEMEAQFSQSIYAPYFRQFIFELLLEDDPSHLRAKIISIRLSLSPQ